VWQRRQFTLPWIGGDYVILTPKDMLTRDENWINKRDLVRSFDQLPIAIPDGQLRAQVSNYFERALIRRHDREPTQKERAAAAASTILQFPQLIDYYIRLKEQRGEQAESISSERVFDTERIFIHQLREFRALLLTQTRFYSLGHDTYEEAHARLAYLKDVIENKGGHRIFYNAGQPVIRRETDPQIMYRLVWFGSPSDVSTEVNCSGLHSSAAGLAIIANFGSRSVRLSGPLGSRCVILGSRYVRRT